MTASGTFAYTFQAADTQGHTGTSATCSITIVPAPLLATCSALNSGTVGVPLNIPAMSVTGGTAPYTFSIGSGTLPAGLMLNALTGAVTGTPTAAGSFTMKITDTAGVIASATCSITIVPAPLLATCSALNSGTVGVPLNIPAMSVTGGTAPYNFSIGSGILPAGLTLNALTGAVTGTPTAAGSFTLKIADAAGVIASATCSITIVPAPLLATCSALNSGTVGVPLNIPAMSVTGGTAPYAFSIGSGTLPAGLTLNALTGAVTGTPTAASSFTLKIADAAGVVASATCSITIVPAPTATCIVINAALGVPITPVTMTGSGGTGGTYTFSATGLPTGITMASNGFISGTPTVSGTFPHAVTVKDGVGNTGTFNCSVTVVLGVIKSGDYVTYTQGGWGASPNGGNPGTLLKNSFSKVYPGGTVTIGGAYKLTFNGSAAIDGFLPQGGTPGTLGANGTNPTSSAAGVFAGQILALQLSVDFSNKGITSYGLASLKLIAGPLAGQTIGQVLELANTVLGGNTSALPSGLKVSGLNDILNAINNNFDGGSTNGCYVR